MPRVRVPAALYAVVAAAMLAVGLSGCVVSVGGGAVAGYTILAEDLSPEQQLQDVAIKAVVVQNWAGFSQELVHRLDATVFDGQVLITGRVPVPAWRDEAVKRAWRVKGVRQVYDEIVVGADTHFIDSARDAWMSTELRGALIADVDVKSIDYLIKTSDRVVYLLGVARSRGELDRVIGHARAIPDTRRVISFIHLMGARPAPRSSPPPASIPPQPAPRGTIKAEPLPQ